MAVNDILAAGLEASPPATAYATLDYRAGGSTPAESFPVWDFDASATEYLDLVGVMSPRYSGAALKVRLPWTATSATTGGVRWEGSFRRLDTAEDVDTSLSYTFQGATATAPGTNGFPLYTEVAFSAAQIDGVLAGEMFVLRIRRKHDDAGDTMTGDAELWASQVLVLET